MVDFSDIRIIGLDDAASEPAGRGPLMNMVLKLTTDAPADWNDAFDQAWKRPALSMRRKAVVKGDTLTSTCMSYELRGQIDQLNKVISATNQSHRLAAQQAVERLEVELRNLKASLHYD